MGGGIYLWAICQNFLKEMKDCAPSSNSLRELLFEKDKDLTLKLIKLVFTKSVKALHP